MTNSISLLPQTDEIIMLDANGSIAEIGSYENLIASSTLFSDFVKKFMKEDDDNANNSWKDFDGVYVFNLFV